MKKMLSALTLATLFSAAPMAQDLEYLNDDFVVDYYGEVNGNYIAHEDYDYNYTYGWLSVSATWKNKIRMVLTTSLTAIFEDNDIKLDDDFSMEEFISAAYIEIKEVGGAPVAIIVGKRSIPFAKEVLEMPIFGNNPIANDYDIEGVFGFSVRLDEGLFGIFDEAEFSAFETGENDFSIGTINGASVRLSKELADNIVLNLGYAHMDGEEQVDGPEDRVTIGLVAKSSDGDLVGWTQGMLFSNNPDHPDSDFAVSAGVKYQVFSSTDVVVEVTYVEKEVMQYAIGTSTAVTARFTVGVEARYNDYQDGREDEIIYGVNAKYEFGSYGYAPNEEYLFDGN